MEDQFSVYLRGISIYDLAAAYLKKSYIDISTPLSIDETNINESQDILKIDDSPDGNFEFELGINNNFGYILYKVYDQEGNYTVADSKKKYNCMHCLRLIEKNPLGIPVKKETLNNKAYYHMIDIFCTFNCCLSELQFRSKNSLYTNSLSLLEELFEICTGRDKSELCKTSDRRFLKVFNGSLCWDTFHNNTIRYSNKNSNVYFVPVTECIEQD